MVKSIEAFGRPTPFNYPGERNQGNFMLIGGKNVVDISEEEALDRIEADNRIPVLAFGRNASPTGAVGKTTRYAKGELTTATLGTFPMIKATLPGHDVVLHGRPSQVGGYFAELYRAQSTK